MVEPTLSERVLLMVEELQAKQAQLVNAIRQLCNHGSAEELQAVEIDVLLLEDGFKATLRKQGIVTLYDLRRIFLGETVIESFSLFDSERNMKALMKSGVSFL